MGMIAMFGQHLAKFQENSLKIQKKHLREQGLRTTLKGACGYETYDVMEITL